MSIVKFFQTFLSSPTTVGAIAPSSQKLAHLITDRANLVEAPVILEFGTGTGVFTEKILAKKNKDALFLAFELNPQLADVTQKKCPEAIICRDSAAKAKEHLEERGISQCDCIISGLPWATLPETVQNDIFEAMLSVLKPGGKFLTFAYLNGLFTPSAQKFRKKLKENFSQVEKTPTIWKNLPPAFVYCCTR